MPEINPPPNLMKPQQEIIEQYVNAWLASNLEAAVNKVIDKRMAAEFSDAVDRVIDERIGRNTIQIMKGFEKKADDATD